MPGRARLAASSRALVVPPSTHIPLPDDQPHAPVQKLAHAMSTQGAGVAGGEVAVSVTGLLHSIPSSLFVVRPPKTQPPAPLDQPQPASPSLVAESLSPQSAGQRMAAQISSMVWGGTVAGGTLQPGTWIKSSLAVVRPPSWHPPLLLDQPQTVPGIVSGLQSLGHTISAQVAGLAPWVVGGGGGFVGSGAVLQISASSLPVVRPPKTQPPAFLDQPQPASPSLVEESLSPQSAGQRMAAQISSMLIGTVGGVAVGSEVAGGGGATVVAGGKLHASESSLFEVRPPSWHPPLFLDQPQTVPGIASELQSLGHKMASQVSGAATAVVGGGGGIVGAEVTGASVSLGALHSSVSSLPVVRPP